MIKYSHKQTALCSYVLGQIALHVYLQKVICGKNKTSLVHVRLLSDIGSGSSAIFEHKTSIRCIFYSCFNFYLKKKGGGIFGDQSCTYRDGKLFCPLATKNLYLIASWRSY